MRKTYCFDLDDTICYPNHEYNDTQRRYLEAKPNNIVIDKINILHDLGNEIIIFTARRMITHNRDIKKIKADVELITINWLKKYKVNYDRLLFGKPYADFYIDDKAIELQSFIDE